MISALTSAASILTFVAVFVGITDSTYATTNTEKPDDKNLIFRGGSGGSSSRSGGRNSDSGSGISGRNSLSRPSCRSNETHIGWLSSSSFLDAGDNIFTKVHSRSSSSNNVESSNNSNEGKCWYQTRKEAEKDCLSYLQSNIMSFDVPNMETLGFHSSSFAQRDEEEREEEVQASAAVTQGEGGGALNYDNAILRRRTRHVANTTTTAAQAKNDHDAILSLPDGLSDGIVNHTIYSAFDAKIKYRWADSIPHSVYMEYVSNYANVNEARTNWRPLIGDALRPFIDRLVDKNLNPTIADVVRVVNTNLWMALGKMIPQKCDSSNSSNNGDDDESNAIQPIVFKGGQTPLVYDPMSVISFGYGSCTGLSILLTNALRSVGVPARMAGTPAWHGNDNDGNHNWVEVYDNDDDGGEWKFMEPTAGANRDAQHVDGIDLDPCHRWFCNAKNFDGLTQVYAARLDSGVLKKEGVFYPMAWDGNNRDVPGEDRTQYYIDVCSKC